MDEMKIEVSPAGDPPRTRAEILAKIEKLKEAKGTIRRWSDRLITDQAVIEVQLRECAFFTLTGLHKNDLTYRRVRDQLNAVIFQREMISHAEYYVGMRIRALEWELPDDGQLAEQCGADTGPSGTGAYAQEPLGQSGGAGDH